MAEKVKAGKVIRKMRLQDGDVLLIKRGSGLDTKEAVSEMTDIFQKNYPFRMVFIVVGDLDDISKADPEIMRQNGWLKIPEVRKT